MEKCGLMFENSKLMLNTLKSHLLSTWKNIAYK